MQASAHADCDQCSSFVALPLEVLLAVCAQLVTAPRSLQSLAASCRGLASLFRHAAAFYARRKLANVILQAVFNCLRRDKQLWHHLILQRWGLKKNTYPQSERESLRELQSIFAMRRPVQQNSDGYISERIVDVFGPVPAGHYQLRLHKEHHQSFHERSFRLEFTEGSKMQHKQWSEYYELMYNDEHTITTNHFRLDSGHSYFHIHKPPSGLQSIQLCKLHKGDLIKVSPVFVSSATAIEHIDTVTTAGVDEDGSPIYISLRFGNHAELGRCSKHQKFVYGRYGSYREESAPHKQFQGKSAWPGVLVNLEHYQWISTSMQRVHSLRHRAVLFGQAQDGSLHAIRVLFRGWQHATLPNGEQSCVMRTNGPILSLLPGKFVFGKDGLNYVMFTWKGRATGGPAVRLAVDQEFEMLCYRVAYARTYSLT